MLSLDQIVHTDFASLLGEEFALIHGTEQVALRLVEVVPGRHTPKGHRRPFSLLFRAAPGPYLPQGMYAFAHEKLGTLELFAVPVSGDQNGREFEVTFN